MYFDPSFCHFEASSGMLYCTLPWSGQQSRLHPWAAGCRFEVKGNNGWRAAPDDADLPILSDVFSEEDTSHPFYLYEQTLPQAVSATVSQYGTGRQAMLQVCAASERAMQLLENIPNLLWFLAPFLVKKSKNDEAAIHTLLGYKQKQLLSSFCGNGQQLLVRLLRMLPAPFGTASYRQALACVASDDSCSSVFRHKAMTDWPLIFFAARNLTYFSHPAVRRLFLDEIPFVQLQEKMKTLGVMYRDTARVGRLLGIADIPALIHACNTYEAIVNLHDRWTQRLNAQNRASYGNEPNIIFPPPPLPGTEAIQPILTEWDLRDEGVTMHHCVGGYTFMITAGLSYIYRIIQPQRATLEVQPGNSGLWTIAQIKAFCNAKVSEETRQSVLAWLREAQRSGYSFGNKI